jgi:hypothetical protein
MLLYTTLAEIKKNSSYYGIEKVYLQTLLVGV